LTTRLSTKGQTEQEFPETPLEELIGCLSYAGPAYSVEEMNAAIAEAVQVSAEGSQTAQPWIRCPE
jgi:hypothetical protein